MAAAWSALLLFAAPSFAQDVEPSQRRPVHRSDYSEFLESLDRELPNAPRVDSLERVVEFAEQWNAVEPEQTAPPASSWPALPRRFALRHTGEIDATRVDSAARRVGLRLEEVEPQQRPGWSFVRFSAGSEDPSRRRALVEQITAGTGVEFVSPVLGNGPAWALATPDILLQLTEETTLTIEEVLAEYPELEIVETDFGGIPRAYRLHDASGDGVDVLTLAASLDAEDAVEWAEPDMVVSATAEYIPNDPGFSNLWGFRNTGQLGGQVGFDMNVDAAWDVTKGSNAVKVLILDTGTNFNHPDLNEWAAQDFTGTALGACDNHGTCVAGCVSARIDNGIGTVGAAPLSPSLSARVFVSSTNCSSNSGSLQLSHVINALNWGEQQGALVSNTSLSFGSSPACTAAYDTRRANGMVHFAAAGNGGSTVSVYPASLNSVHDVANVNRFGGLGNLSNHNTDVLSAPGEEIYTTDRVGSAGYNTGGDYHTINGTSFASPYVAGVAALVRSVNPQLTPDGVETILRQTAIDIGASGRDSTFGWGLVDAHAAVLAAQQQVCQLGGYCHPVTQGYGTGSGAFYVCSQQPITCGVPATLKLYNVPANQPAWLILADQLQPFQNPALAGWAVDPTPITIVNVTTDASGAFCLPNLSNCGSAPLFLQALWVRPGQTTLGVSEIVRMNYGPLPVYEVGPNHTFGRIQDAINAAQASNPPLPPVVQVHTGTYYGPLSWHHPLVIQEAPGETAVLTNSGSSPYLLDIGSWQTTALFAEWRGIDIVAAGTLTGIPIDVAAFSGVDVNVTFVDMNISDVPGVSATSQPFFRVWDSFNPPKATVSLYDVNVNAVNYPYGPFFRVQGDSSVLMASNSSFSQAPPGTRITINTSAENLIDVQSTAVPGFYLKDAFVQQIAPREELLAMGGGALYALRCKFDLPVGAIGALRHDANSGDTVLLQCLVDARNGTQQSVFRMPGGGSAGLGIYDSAVLFSADITANHVAIDASMGGRVNFERSTLFSSTTNVEACAIQGPTTPVDPSGPLGMLTGRVDHSIFHLPGSNDGVVRSLMGRVALAHGAENVRYTGAFIPAETDLLPGKKYDLDPLLAADGYHLSSPSALPKRLRPAMPAVDIDGVGRFLSSDFGCDYTTPPAQPGLHVGPGQTYSTIQSAINAATAGQTVVVHNGTYNETIHWNKPVNVVEAWGEQAVLRPTGTSSLLYVIKQELWAPNSDARWDGIDVEVANTGNNDVIYVAGAGNLVVCTVRFANCRFTDAPSTWAGADFFRLVNRDTFLVLENTIVDPQSHHYFTGFNVPQLSYVSVQDSYVSFDASQTAKLSGGANFGFLNCEIVDRGSEIVSISGNSTMASLYRTRVKTKTGRGTPTVATINGDACIVGVVQSFIDATNGTGLSPFKFMNLTTSSTQLTPWLTMINSAVVFHSGRTESRCAVDVGNGGKVSMAHCTLRNVEDAPQYLSYGNGIRGPNLSTAHMTGDFQNNLFDVPGSSGGAILHTLSGTMAVTVSQNVVNVLPGGTGLFERLPGPPIAANPNIASDSFHLTLLSNATMVRAGPASVNFDIEGDVRPAPNATAPNFGCDEILP